MLFIVFAPVQLYSIQPAEATVHRNAVLEVSPSFNAVAKLPEERYWAAVKDSFVGGGATQTLVLIIAESLLQIKVTGTVNAKAES